MKLVLRKRGQPTMMLCSAYGLVFAVERHEAKEQLLERREAPRVGIEQQQFPAVWRIRAGFRVRPIRKTGEGLFPRLEGFHACVLCVSSILRAAFVRAFVPTKPHTHRHTHTHSSVL